MIQPKLSLLPRSLIIADHPLSVPIYDGDGILLAEKGTVLSFTVALNLSKQTDLYTIDKELLKAISAIKKNQGYEERIAFKISSVIKRFEKLEDELKVIFVSPKEIDINPLLSTTIARIQVLCEKSPDTALAKILLDEKSNYTVRHSIHTATLCELASSFLNWNKEERRSLLGAALTMNISLGLLQDELQTQSSPLTGDQRRIIDAHPTNSGSLLRSLGVDNESWLDFVEKHHETTDGKGYPLGLQGSALPLGAVLLNVADVYCAKITGRTYRTPIKPDIAARDIYLVKNKHDNDSIVQVFVKILGLYPPGSIVQLANKEIGIVTKRGNQVNTPAVKALLSPAGKRYGSPVLRKTDVKSFAVIRLMDPEIIRHKVSEELIWSTLS